jgi:hypothetical protein
LRCGGHPFVGHSITTSPHGIFVQVVVFAGWAYF